MASEIEEIRRQIDVDEPNYPELAASLGPAAVPHLRTLVTDDPAVAAKATYLLSLLPSAASLEGIQAAARSADETVRVAAAAALGNITSLTPFGVDATPAEEAVRRLLADPDPGVRKVAVRSAQAVGLRTVRAALERMASEDPEDQLRRAAEDTLRDLS